MPNQADPATRQPRVLIWNEHIHERTNDQVASLYPSGIHGAIAALLAADPRLDVNTATLADPDCGLAADRLEKTDVLIWWGHAAHGDVSEVAITRAVQRVWEGMGLIVLHSAHFSKLFKALMGAPCSLAWREAGERERLWITDPYHPITAGLPPCFELEHEEMYSEPFAIPEPHQTVMLSWFQGGEVFRSGVTYRRGAGKIFYFRPGHETYPTFYNEHVGQVLRNAVWWADNPQPPATDITQAPNRPDAPESLEIRGPRLHKDGDKGFA
ncbi:MAG: ThuA domain-containing protein [Pseudomonadota bacterium]